MTINFNFKKYWKYFILGVLCYILLHSFTNVKALTPLPDNYGVNINTRGISFLEYIAGPGNSENLNQYYIQNMNINDFNVYYNNFKQKVALAKGYNTFEDLTNDYYFITMFRVQNNTQRTLDTFLYLCDKNTNQYCDTFNPGLAIATKSSSPGNSSEYEIHFGSLYYNDVYYNQVNPVNFSSDFSLQTRFTNIQVYCRSTFSSDSSCVSSTFGNSTTLYLYTTNTNLKVTGNLFWDTNKSELNYYFTTLTSSWSTSVNYYNFTKLTINDNDTTYNLLDILLENYLSVFNINKPNIQDLGNNSYGVNSNTISNIFLDFSNNISTTINCPDDKEFLNNTCFLYTNDIENFNQDNTNVSNSAIWYVGNNDTLSFDSSKFYILSFRVYTQYNLDILTTIYHLNDENIDRPFNIISKYVSDNVLYKDFSLIIQPTHTGSNYLSFFNIVFKPLSNFTNNLDNSFNFGVFKTFKITEYSTQPTQTDVENELNKNSLSNISNNSNGSFFSDFRRDDFGLSSIVLYPLNFARGFMNYSCSSLYLPIPHLSNVGLPCVSSLMSENVPTIWDLYKLIFNGFIIYRILINMFSIVKNSYRPDNDRIEVVDL